jgi:putative (di)nucleoside polyphosphate hydrolase
MACGILGPSPDSPATMSLSSRTHPTSCGTLLVNQRGQILLCHVTGTRNWDIPKGMQDPGESTLDAAMRELFEEAGLVFDASAFEDLGSFDYRRDKRLHLYKVQAPAELESLDALQCTSYFPHQYTGAMTPEVDGFMWAGRDEVRTLCWPRMAERLLGLGW